MPDIDQFAKQLLEEAKRFLEKSTNSTQSEAKNAFLHSSLMLGFCAFEAHVNSIADDFLVRSELTVLDRAVLSEKEFRLESGEYVVTSSLKIYRLTDRIEFIYRKFSGVPIDKSQKWWIALKAALSIRNELTHPKQETHISEEAIRSALLAIIETIDAIYRGVYRRPYPPAARGLNSSLTF